MVTTTSDALRVYIDKLLTRRDHYRQQRDHGGFTGDGATFWNGKYHETSRIIDDLLAIYATTLDGPAIIVPERVYMTVPE